MSSGDGDDRRRHRRFKMWVPARIEGRAASSQLAIGHDVSMKGLLLVTTADAPPVGEAIRIVVTIPPDGTEEHALAARVVRREVNEADPHGLWPVQIAVELEEAEPELERIVEAYASRGPDALEEEDPNE
jgi:hypothetical protein